MCTNRALTDLYASSARFIQLLNRKWHMFALPIIINRNKMYFFV